MSPRTAEHMTWHQSHHAVDGVMVHPSEPIPMEPFVETHVWSQDRQKGVQQFMDNHAQHFVICLFIHFIL